MRYFISLSYDGSRYHGWQVQPNGISVQGELNRCLSALLREDILTTGAGRTDAGVHARLMVAHFDTGREVDCDALAFKLNAFLPADIAIAQIRPVRPDAHARFSARWRTYHYWVYTRKDPFRRQYATLVPGPLDFARMNEAARMLLDVSDFTSFAKLHGDAKTNICHVTRAEWRETEPGLWRFEISADRFLRNMVRAVVGTLLQVGRGRLSLDDFARVIARKDRCAAGDSVPAGALFLVDIGYDEAIYDVTTV